MVTNFLIAFVVPSTTARASVMLLPIVMMIMRSLRWETLRPRTGILESLWHCRGDTGHNLLTGAIVTTTSSQILGYQLYQGPDRYGDFLDEVVHCLCSCCHYHTGSQPLSEKCSLRRETVLLRGEDDGPGGRVQGLGKMNGWEVRPLIIFLITIFCGQQTSTMEPCLVSDISPGCGSYCVGSHLPHAPCRDLLTWKAS